MKRLEKTYKNLVRQYTDDEKLIESMWNFIVSQYEPRYYHNLYHLKYMIDELSQIKKKITDWNSVLFAIFYHDIYYEVFGSLNEYRSAVIAKHELTKINHQDIEKIQLHIIATKDHLKTECSDTNYLLDVDMWRLGDKPFLFEVMSQLIREEFIIVPDKIFYPKRLEFLKHLMNRDYIFITDYFKNEYEQQAIENITNEIKELFNLIK